MSQFSPVFGAGGHVEASATPVHPAGFARVDRGLTSGHNSLAQAGGIVDILGFRWKTPCMEEEQQEHWSRDEC